MINVQKHGKTRAHLVLYFLLVYPL